jgi:hypothetical protein
MISSRVTNVLTLLQQYDQFLKDSKLNEQLVSRAGELKSAEEGLEEPQMRVALQRERNWIQDSQLPLEEIDKMQALISDIRTWLSRDPGVIDGRVNRLVKGCGSVANKVDRHTEVVWSKVVERSQPAVDEAELNRCGQFVSESATVEEIRRLKRIPVARVPTNRDALHEIENRWDRLRELIAGLPKDSDNPDVKRFLDAVRKGGAPLNFFTDSVRQYLEETGKVSGFRIYQER